MIEATHPTVVEALELARQMMAERPAAAYLGDPRLYRMGLWLPGRVDGVRLFGPVGEQYKLSYCQWHGIVREYEAAIANPGDAPLLGVFPVNDDASFAAYRGLPKRKA